MNTCKQVSLSWSTEAYFSPYSFEICFLKMVLSISAAYFSHTQEDCDVRTEKIYMC